MNTLNSAAPTARPITQGSSMHWLLQAQDALACAHQESELLEIAHAVLSGVPEVTGVAVAVIEPVDSALVCRVISGPAGTAIHPHGMARSFEPGTPLRALLYGPDLGPDGAGYLDWDGKTLPDGGWPFPGSASQIWISLRVGPEITGCLMLVGTAGSPLSLVAFANTLAIALRMHRLRDEHSTRRDELDSGLHRLIDELSWLRTTSSQMAAWRAVSEVIDRTYDAVRLGLGFDRVGIFLIQEQEGRSLAVEVAGTDSVGERISYQSGTDLGAPDLAEEAPDMLHVMAGNAYYYCPDRWAITPVERRDGMDAEMHEQIMVALRHSDRLLGFISVDNALTNRPLPESQADVLITFAQQVSSALENARLTEAEAQARTRAEALLRASQAMNSALDLEEVLRIVAKEARQALQARTCDLYLFDEQSERTIASFHEGYTDEEHAMLFASGIPATPPAEIPAEREMLRSQRPLVIDRERWPSPFPEIMVRLGITAQLAVPLLVEREGIRVVLGVLYASYSGKRPSAITAEEVELASALATQAATAIEKAHLYAAERDRARRLEELDGMRREFVATITHELRTPLTGILGFTQMLLHYWPRMDEERRHGTVEKIATSAMRLDRLVRDLLLASRIDDARLTVKIAPVDVLITVGQAVEEIRAKYKGQRISVQGPHGDAIAQADPERMAQILVNLLDNAVKYSPEGSPVEVGISVGGGRVRIAIRDHGPGLSEAQIGRLFQRFGRLGHATRAGQVGTGLGLYITKHLAQAMNGEILVQSVLGEGATFTLDLPDAG